MATHSSILAWEIPWMEEPGGYSPWGCKELDMTEQLHFYFPNAGSLGSIPARGTRSHMPQLRVHIP